MKVDSSKDKITIYTYKKEDSNNINDYIKELILRLKKKYKINIFGFYEINIYINDKVGMIIDIIKDDEDYFYDLLDLKIKVYENSPVYLKFNDYFLNDEFKFKILDNYYYIDVENISKEKFLSMIEFCNLVYGEDLEILNKKMQRQ